MALEEFEDGPDEKEKRYLRMRSVMDYGMGCLWITMGVFLLFPDKFSNRFGDYNNPLMKVFAGICVLYGAFRIYRGYRKNYYNER